MRIPAIAFAALAAISGCGEKKPAAPAPAPTVAAPAASAVEVAAIDEFGPLAAEATGVAFWLHPAVPFNSLVIAATGAGLAAYNIEDGAEVARSDGWDARGVALYYDGVFSRDAENSARSAVGIVLAGDVAAGAFRAFEIDNESRAFKPLAVSGAASIGDSHCAGPQSRLPARLAVVAGATLVFHDVQRTEIGLALAESGRMALPSKGVDCAISPVDGTVYVALETGDVLRRLEADGGGVENVFAAGATRPKGVAIAANNPPDGDDDATCCGEILVLDSANATVGVFDVRDGGALGAVRLKSSFDVDGVASATAFGVASGNFGAAYRDGVVALAADGGTPVIRLTPLNGVMEALGRPVGAPRDPRRENPRADEVQCADPGLTEDQRTLCVGTDAFALPPPEIKLPE